MWCVRSTWRLSMRRWHKVASAVLAGGVIVLASGATPEDRGKELFGRRCSGCHALDLNKEGPRLRGVYGQRAAAVPDFGYSDALKKAGIRWDDATLDRWLSDPEAMVPNSDMAFHLDDGQERKAVIAYLKSVAK